MEHTANIFGRICKQDFEVKFGCANRVQVISTENLFVPSKREGSRGLTLAKPCDELGLNVANTLRLSSRVGSACGRKMRNIHNLYVFVSSSFAPS